VLLLITYLSIFLYFHIDKKVSPLRSISLCGHSLRNSNHHLQITRC